MNFQVSTTTHIDDCTVDLVHILTLSFDISSQHEDGSYTYGYEAADGSFKLETRFPDGLVQGKYGYVDIDSGELKVIEYGADMMGFQPIGDLPFGVVNIPGTQAPQTSPKVRPTTTTTTTSTTTSTTTTTTTTTRKHMRRNQLLSQFAPRRNPSQVRGLQLEQPITTRPRSRRPLSRVPIKGRQSLVNFSSGEDGQGGAQPQIRSTKRSRQVLSSDEEPESREETEAESEALDEQEQRNLPQILPPSPLHRPINPLKTPKVSVNFDYLIQEFTGKRTIIPPNPEGSLIQVDRPYPQSSSWY